MNQWPKLECVISDLDGSLLNSQKKVSPRDLETIKKLKEKGILFFISTLPIFQGVNKASYFALIISSVIDLTARPML